MSKESMVTMQFGQKSLKYRLKITLQRFDIFFGPGVAELLELVGKTGSISSAAKQMGMSYSKAWNMIRNMETELQCLIVQTHSGGQHGGSSKLTPDAVRFLDAYKQFEQELEHAAGIIFERCFSNLS